MKRSFNVRLTTIFGEREVRDAIKMMVVLAEDPTALLTDEAQQKLFKRLRSDHRAMRKSNAQSRAHYAAQQKAKA